MTREKLESEALELGLKVDNRWSDETLQNKINEELERPVPTVKENKEDTILPNDDETEYSSNPESDNPDPDSLMVRGIMKTRKERSLKESSVKPPTGK